jgi:hypothetical protein
VLVTLTAPTRDKLVKILDLTGSDVEGEALAALTAARRILTANGLTWSDVIAPPSSPEPEEQDDADDTDDADDSAGVSIPDAIDYCLSFDPPALTDWERSFLLSLRGFETISDKQYTILCRIVAKCQAAPL